MPRDFAVVAREPDEVRWVPLPLYRPSRGASALRQARINAGLSLRKAGVALGLTAAQLNDLEHGRARFAEPRDYERAGMEFLATALSEVGRRGEKS